MTVWSKWLECYLTLLIVLWPLAGIAWEEPSEFRGMKFGKDLTKTIPSCPSDFWPNSTIKKLYKPWETKIRCWEPSQVDTKAGEMYYTFHNFGPIGDVVVQMSGFQLNHRLGQIILLFSSESFSQLLTIFIARYGEPSQQNREEVANAFGATFLNQIAEWHGSNVSIRMKERWTKIDEGIITLTTDFWRDHVSKKAIDRVKKGRDDL
jgi:hypothetical protein